MNCKAAFSVAALAAAAYVVSLGPGWSETVALPSHVDGGTGSDVPATANETGFDRPAASEPERQPPKAKPAPRCCPQRNRYKQVLTGPLARQPLCSGQHPTGLRTLTKRPRLASHIAEEARQESTIPTGPALAQHQE